MLGITSSGLAQDARGADPLRNPSAPLVGNAPEDTRPADCAPTFRDVQSSIGAEVERGKVPSVAFAVLYDGVIVCESAVGWTDKEGGIAATVNTPYPLASTSKPIVATAAMILHERGSLDLDAPAFQYVGTWFPPEPVGTPAPTYRVRQLLNHTSGLGTYAAIYWRGENRSVRDLETSFGKYGFAAQPPGAVFEYSNLGYGLIGHIIAEQSGMPLARFLDTEIFAPLGMRNSGLVDSFSAPAAAARKYDGAGTPLVDTYNDTPGAGSVYASAHDLALFSAFHLSDDASGPQSFLSGESKQLMRSFVEPGALYPYYGGAHYGLGWYFRTSAGGEEIVWHEGGMPGASTLIVLLPQRNVAAIILINATDANALAQSFADALIRAIEPDAPDVSFTATDGLSAYGGEPGFLGRWEGSIRIDGDDLPWTLSFEGDGTVRAEFPGGAGEADAASRKVSPALAAVVSGDLLVATFEGTLPSADVAQTADGYTLLRLVRRRDTLTGFAVAYGSAGRLEYLYPFAASLRRNP